MKLITAIVRFSLCGVFAASLRSAPALDFELPRFGGGDSVKLSHFAGQIVVLDFFAYWCGPCAKSTPLVEEQIQKFYAAKQGNPQKIPVQVISINVESEAVDQTARFIKKHGPNLVVNDRDGGVLKSYGGSNLPFLVVIDGTKATTNHPSFELVYREAGFAGADKLRRLIDGLGTIRP